MRVEWVDQPTHVLGHGNVKTGDVVEFREHVAKQFIAAGRAVAAKIEETKPPKRNQSKEV